MQSARDWMVNVLSQKNDNVALLKRLLSKRDEILDITEEMEQVESFFKSQREIFNKAQSLHTALQHERDYFATDRVTNDKIIEIATILSMPKPYARIKDLFELMQDVKAAYDALITQKKEEVAGILQRCMGDVHTLASASSKPDVKDELNKADAQFAEFKKKIVNAETITLLDALITQLLNYKDQVCKRIAFLVHDADEKPDGQNVKPKKIVQVRRYEAFPVKWLNSRDDVDNYLEDIRKKLYSALENSDGIEIN